jgi:D-alanyl-D-alanine carboxypeptidase
VLVFFIGIGGVTLTDYSNQYPVDFFENQKAQILAVETGVLRTWAANNSLQSNLQLGSKGREVRLLQQMLSQDTVAYPSKSITGMFGTQTEAAVRRFQIDHGITPTGTVNTETRTLLNTIFFSHLCPIPEVLHPDYILHKITKNSPLPLDYVPSNLVDISGIVPTTGVTCVREDVVLPIVRMFDAARADGVFLRITSAYRKPEIQSYLYKVWTAISGYEVKDEVALPGHSEHQLGTTIDITDRSIGYEGVSKLFATSEGGVWMKQNAHRFGFALSYPEDKIENTGYIHEPWHWRYVSEPIAIKLLVENKIFNELDFTPDGSYIHTH